VARVHVQQVPVCCVLTRVIQCVCWLQCQYCCMRARHHTIRFSWAAPIGVNACKRGRQLVRFGLPNNTHQHVFMHSSYGANGKVRCTFNKKPNTEREES
jgi:hypothetical protein